MAGATSAADVAAYGDVVVIGGGCYGSYYVRQLARARQAGRIVVDRIVVVDRDAACAVARDAESRHECEIVVRDWAEFLSGYLPTSAMSDAIVPSPLMPHLLYDWLLDRARARWPGRDVATVALPRPVGTPWFRAGDVTSYASFATWMCPINCIEPRTCPHTRTTRDWTMPDALRDAVAAATTEGEALVGPVIFHCTHRAFGVGMIDARDVVASDALVAELAGDHAASVLVGTVSHCHGALSVLRVGPPR